MLAQQGRLSYIPEGWFAQAWRCKRRMCVTWTDIERHLPLQGYMAFLDALHVEAHGRDGAMAKYQRKDQRRGNSWLRDAARTDAVETVLAACAT